MKVVLPLFFAKRYIVSKKSNNAINFISWISVFAIAVGTAALIMVLSGMNGLNDLVKSLYNSFDPEIKISKVEGKTFVPDESKMLALKKVKGIAYVSRIIEDKALVKYGDQQMICTVKGVDDQFVAMSRFDTLVFDGAFLKPGDRFAVLGRGLAYRIGMNSSDIFSSLTFFSPKKGTSFSLNPEDSFTEVMLPCKGMFAINDEFDFQYAIVPIAQARTLFAYEHELSAIEIGLQKGTNIAETKKAIKSIMGSTFSVQDRNEQNALLYKTLQSEKLWTFIILSFILVVATFNIIGALTMLIIEKKKDIKILSCLGADIGMIRKIFFVEGMLITVLGATFGLITGTGLCLLQIKYGFIAFNEGFVIDAYPVRLLFQDFALILTTVLFIGFFAAWYPVRLFTRRTLLIPIKED